MGTDVTGSHSIGMTNRPHPSDTRQDIRWGDVALLAVVSFCSPLDVVARSFETVHALWKLLIVGATTLVLGLVVALLLVRVGQRREAAVCTSFAAVCSVVAGGVAIRRFGPLPAGLLIAVVLTLVYVLAARGSLGPLFKGVMVGAAVFLAAIPFMSLVRSIAGDGSNLVRALEAIEVDLRRTPDIVLVVADAYPGWIALEQDMPGYDDTLRRDLLDRGFEVPQSAWSAYPVTRLSVPSILDMEYPLLAPFEGDATVRALYERIGTKNRLVQVLDTAGYETYMVEAGWSGSACGGMFDHCVMSPFLDEAVFIPAYKSIFGEVVFSKLGYAFSQGALHTHDWLLENLKRVTTDARPSFVLAHLMAPHPPFFLGPECHLVVSDDRAGVEFQQQGTPEGARERYFEDQRACVDRMLLEIADVTGPDDVVVIVGDHGTDRRHQLSIVGWDEEAIAERMNVLAAYRADDCVIGDPILLPNIFRRLLSCLGDREIPDLEARMWTNRMIEVGPSTVDALLSGSR